MEIGLHGRVLDNNFTHARRMPEGWIKIHRKLLNNNIVKYDHTAFIVFMALLLVVDKSTGRRTMGRFQLAELTGLKPITAYKSLKRLEKKWQMVTLSSNNKYTDVSIVNWGKYQCNKKSGNTLGNIQVTTKEQRGNNAVTLNKNRELRIKNKEEEAAALKEKFFSNPLMGKIRGKYPNRDYDYQFDLMCSWYREKKKHLPKVITAFENWLKNTKPDMEVVKQKEDEWQKQKQDSYLERSEANKAAPEVASTELNKMRQNLSAKFGI